MEGEIAVNKFAGNEKLFIKNGSGDVVSFSSDQTIGTMISDSISGKADTSAVTESINAATSGKLDTSAFETYSGNVDTEIGLKAAQSDLNTLSGTVTGHTADTNVHFSGSEKTNLDSLATNIATISGITSSNVTSWNGAVTNLGGFKLVEITQSDYDNLPTPRDSKTLYIIRN